MRTGAIKVKPLITAVAPLEEGPQWFERLHARRAEPDEGRADTISNSEKPHR